MTSPILRLSPASRKAKRLLMSGFILAAAVFSIYPGSASASENGYNGKNLPGHTWTIGNGVVLTNEDLIQSTSNTSSSVCVGPVTHDGSGFHAPYGWHCEKNGSDWSFSAITAAAGFYNPNSGTIGEYSVLAYGA
jgi:hypothetical protein